MKQAMQWKREDYWITTDKSNIDVNFVHNNLTQLFWARGIEFEKVKTAVENSLCFLLSHQDKKIGFARLITDFSTFSYVVDVFIIDEYQKKGLGRWLMECVLQHPAVTDVDHVTLVTSSASWLYKKLGFKPVTEQDFVWTLEKKQK
ncbi:GNAT family N-acetyltransferase [Xenorhabdus sp. KJ12.1]|uniref:GNAT family N-acetyltransferase n=1 Tax=Xenorhabdus sp. KJ12.1 TaxID=1851571 RepID=UPI000C0478CB|nr:GNAT family N-acetyltransferase [Xenorhabdus sp. KJ12.1]PHM68303.1 histone acetyltransferase [Xenorhabdus sp. KJ12.1]